MVGMLVVQEVLHADMTLTRSKVKVKVFLRGFLVVAVVCRLDLKKWYVPFGKTDCKPTRTGIALRVCEWFAFNQTVEYLHRDYPDVVNYTAFSHSSTRPSGLHGMQPVSDPAVNCSSMTDVACL